MRGIYWLLLVLVIIPSTEALSQVEDPAHDELRAMREDLIEAVNTNDVERVLSHLHEQVIVTWLNGEVSRGPEEVKAYYDRMMLGDSPVVKSITVDPTVERLSDLYGDTAVAYGSSSDNFKLTSGLDFQLSSRWSATVRKVNGKWLIVNFHASTNMFDNALLNLAKRSIYWSGGIGFAAGAALLAVFFVVRGSRKKNA